MGGYYCSTGKNLISIDSPACADDLLPRYHAICCYYCREFLRGGERERESYCILRLDARWQANTRVEKSMNTRGESSMKIICWESGPGDGHNQ